ncbi:ketol-acid reductoisomerase [Candidatus Tremblaya princeps]|uniref:Ketol-acid reductoisomerase (NADP(+)) n=1 Tax=Tremblaya princeps TaxID=189385 RepID=A0A1C3K8Y1_TREPR|nr:ketol-acid reductoisomerase [Candidatus Tremblaya princeps]SBT62980.1 Ketol-acid reductoisomerase [Candidatus Tremblaya princeps]
MRVLYERDGDLSVIRERVVAVVGYGSQGRAHAMNLRDSGVEVVIGLRPGPSFDAAMSDGFMPRSVPDAVSMADVAMMLTPDECMADVYAKAVRDNLRPGASVAFAHGFNVCYNQIPIGKGVGAFMAAPKAPGHMVRETYIAGWGTPHLVAAHPQCENLRALAVSYAIANGGGAAGIIETTFVDETETDLFGEQAVLCGGLVELIRAGFDTLVSSGYEPELAYFECMHEMKLIVDIMNRGGVAALNESISNNAEYGEYVSGPRVIGTAVRSAMRRVLNDIRTGRYAKDFIMEGRSNSPTLTACRRAVSVHPMEAVGSRLRSRMTCAHGA